MRDFSRYTHINDIICTKPSLQLLNPGDLFLYCFFFVVFSFSLFVFSNKSLKASRVFLIA